MALFGRPTARDDERALAYRDWLLKRNPLAIASLVLGIFSLIEFGALLIFGIAGIALGVAALVQLGRAPSDGGGLAVALPPSALPPSAPPPSAPPQSGSADAGPAPFPKTHGRHLAWAGIGLSAASLIVAGLLYFRILG